MRARLILASALTAFLLGNATSIAAADDVNNGGARVENGSPVAHASTSRSRGGRRAGSPPACVYQRLGDDVVVYDVDGSPVPTRGPGHWYTKDCSPLGGTSYVFVSAVNPAALVGQARRDLPLSAPAVATNPRTDVDQLVQFPTWLWVDDGWKPLTATAAVPGVSVTVKATPMSVVWDMGNGDRVVCDGPGTPYVVGRPAALQSTDCSYTYRRSSLGEPNGQYLVTATMTWRVSWSAAGIAGGGGLGLVSRSSSVGLRVAEIQALNE